MIAAAKKYNYGNECEVCGKKFPRGVYKRACSGECKKKLQWTRWNCVVCGKEMCTRKSQATKGGTCSIECGLKLRSENNPRVLSVCVVCGFGFVKSHGKSTCSPECSRTNKQRKNPRHDKPCPYCGKQRKRRSESKGGYNVTCGSNECSRRHCVYSEYGEWAGALCRCMGYLRVQSQAVVKCPWKKKCENIAAGNRIRIRRKTRVKEAGELVLPVTFKEGVKGCLKKANARAVRYAKIKSNPWHLKMETLSRNLRGRSRSLKGNETF